jgi:hypothetical protein
MTPHLMPPCPAGFAHQGARALAAMAHELRLRHGDDADAARVVSAAHRAAAAIVDAPSPDHAADHPSMAHLADAVAACRPLACALPQLVCNALQPLRWHAHAAEGLPYLRPGQAFGWRDALRDLPHRFAPPAPLDWHDLVVLGMGLWSRAMAEQLEGPGRDGAMAGIAGSLAMVAQGLSERDQASLFETLAGTMPHAGWLHCWPPGIDPDAIPPTAPAAHPAVR